jgi:serine/threonine protein phosphatase PrpC
MPVSAQKIRWNTMGSSVRGAAHLRTGLPNQDNWKTWLDQDGGAASAVLAVADGHGSHRHFRSHLGSQFAVATAVSLLRDFVKTTSDAEADGLEKAATKDMPRLLVDGWHAAVTAHFEKNPFTEAELKTVADTEGEEAKQQVSRNPGLAYGATLLAVTATQNWILYLQLGDGDILTVNETGETSRPLPEDSRLMANQTTSLCQPEAWNDFRARLVKDVGTPPALVLLSTDGYSNSFRSEEDFLLIGRDYLEMIRERGVEPMKEELPAILEEASKKGSGDDITLGILRRERRAGSGSSRSEVPTNAEFIRLKNEYTGQAAKLRTLEAEYQRSQKTLKQFKGLVLMVAVLAALGVGALLLRSWKPSPPVTISDPSEKPKEPGKPAATAARPTEWALVLDSGQNVPLKARTKITSKDLGIDNKQTVIAEVSADGRQLKNLSKVSWQVLSQGLKLDVGPQEPLSLKANIHIDFHGASATVTQAPAGSERTSSSSLPAARTGHGFLHVNPYLS